MATLTRVHPLHTHSEREILLDSRVPEPFPVDILRNRHRRGLESAGQETRSEEESLLDDLAREELELDPFDDAVNVVENLSDADEPERQAVRMTVMVF
jgi:hypothetical protein